MNPEHRHADSSVRHRPGQDDECLGDDALIDIAGDEKSVYRDLGNDPYSFLFVIPEGNLRFDDAVAYKGVYRDLGNDPYSFMFVIPEGNLRFDDAGAYNGVYRE